MTVDSNHSPPWCTETAHQQPSSTATGRSSEAAVGNYLRGQGLVLVTRNFHSTRGEIDLIMLDHDLLVFVEVRYRGHGSFTSPAESITWRKRKRIIATARYFLHGHREHARRRCRFDVVSVTRRNYSPSPTDAVEFEWIRDAFDTSTA